jgi:hypothetical protein
MLTLTALYAFFFLVGLGLFSYTSALALGWLLTYIFTPHD